jgi:cathepsin B
LALCSAEAFDHLRITKEHVEKLKKTAPFEVYEWESHPFKGLSGEEIKAKLGLFGVFYHDEAPLPEGPAINGLPENFNSADQWPDCIHPIRDQQSCGSCWAFAASEVLSDRTCIATSGNTNVILSPQDLVSCDKGDLGCNGGYLNRSWDYLVKTGIVADDCYPYTSGKGQTGSCSISAGKCATGAKGTYKKYFASSYKSFPNTNAIKEDIVKNGPVETGFTVYQDFMSYKSGIYKHTTGGVLGGHAVKIVGFGVENGTQYWKVANSWGPSWGEQGHFRIAIGNCCNFDAQIIAGYANTSKLAPLF